MNDEKNQTLTKIQNSLNITNTPQGFKTHEEISGGPGLFWGDNYYVNRELHIPNIIDIRGEFLQNKDGHHIIRRNWNPDLYDNLKNFGEYQANVVNTYYQGIMENISKEVTELTNELESKQKDNKNLRYEISKEKRSRNNLEQEIQNSKEKIKNLIEDRNSLQNSYEETVDDFRQKFEIIGNVGDNQNDLLMKLKVTVAIINWLLF